MGGRTRTPQRPLPLGRGVVAGADESRAGAVFALIVHERTQQCRLPGLQAVAVGGSDAVHVCPCSRLPSSVASGRSGRQRCCGSSSASGLSRRTQSTSTPGLTDRYVLPMIGWSDLPGIELWSIKVLLSGTAPGSHQDQGAVVTAADILAHRQHLVPGPGVSARLRLLRPRRHRICGRRIAEHPGRSSIAEGVKSSYAITDSYTT